jgi:hypothetical protein
MEETTLSEARKLLDAAVTRIPQLTTFGVGLARSHDLLDPEQWTGEMRRQQAQLFTEAGLLAIAASADWLHESEHLFRQYLNSYDYKHLVQRWRGFQGDPETYVSNGSFIAACVGLGLDCKICGPNVLVRKRE